MFWKVMIQLVLFLVLILHCAVGTHDLNEQYRFSADLSPNYNLHWRFNFEAGTIAFAVNVSTTGWVGFGLSPNGQMPGSDVIIGWVDNNGEVQFKDRFAVDRFLPPVDSSQDWFLVNGEEENGYTILEFTRNITSCDVENDLNVEVGTARVIWSYHSSDPASETQSAFSKHEVQGSISLNLLAGLTEDKVEPEDTMEFPITVGNVTIPAVDTTYWCTVSELPSAFQEQEQYIFKTSIILSEGNLPYVHHMLIYLCTELNHTLLGTGGVCDDTHVDIRICRGSEIIAAWAVGGTDFVYPLDVALPVGGGGSRKFVVIEIHYDNPNVNSGVVDDSGIQLTYTSTPPRHRAAALALSAPTSPQLIIPPGTANFTISAFCSNQCTNSHFPTEGITIFGNLLHTHLAGHGLVVDHYRETECGLMEQMEPIDENRLYDFNYQQFNILPKTVKVLPGDEIRLNCFYQTTNRTGVTLGGAGTREEMCTSYLYYYPATDLKFCVSRPDDLAYTEFASKYIPSMSTGFAQTLEDTDLNSASMILNQIEWNQEAINSLKSIYQHGAQATACIAGLKGSVFTRDVPIPSADCPYVSPNTCNGELGSQGRCCEVSGAATLTLSASLATILFSTLIIVIE